MKKKEDRRTVWIGAFLTPKEVSSLREKYKATTCRSFSEWLRDRLFRQPETIFYRIKSLDEFLVVAIAMKKELQSAGRNLDQAIEKLRTLESTAESRQAIERLETETHALRLTAETIRQSLIQINETWSRI
jgi:hypothetical protein